MMIDSSEARVFHREVEHHLRDELLPFWIARCRDDRYGGFLTHFDAAGNDTGVDEKSLISQTRTLYSMSLAHRSGLGQGRCAELARHGLEFLLEKMWDQEAGGFLWMVDRRGRPLDARKVVYGQSFAIYALSEYTRATGEPIGRSYAERTFELLNRKARDARWGGYFEMFDPAWNLAGPGSAGGDRKSFDVHMHLMEAFTSLFRVTRAIDHAAALVEVMGVLCEHMLHPEFKTAMAQFYPDWRPASQIKFDIIWGRDRYAQGGAKANALDTTSFGHNTEFAWLWLRARDALEPDAPFSEKVAKIALDHTVRNGIDEAYGGVFVEGSHGGGVYDTTKEFWQQAEVMVGLLEGASRFKENTYWEAYKNVHRFVFDKVIDHAVGEWRPLLTREGSPIWSHLGDSWKVNYHTIRAMVRCSTSLSLLCI